MSQYRSKREAKSSRAINAPDPMNSASAFTSGHRYPYIPRSTVSSLKSHKQNRLDFALGTNLAFKVLYSTIVLRTQHDSDIDEQVANIYGAKAVLIEARELPTKVHTQSVKKEYVSTLLSIFDNIKDSIELQNEVEQRLLSLKTRSPNPLNNLTLQKWREDGLLFLKHAESLINDFDVAKKLKSTQNAFDQIYHNCLQVVEDNALIIDPQPTHVRACSEPKNVCEIDRLLSSMCRKGPSSLESVWLRFEALCRAYEVLGDIMQGNSFGQSANYSINDLADALRVISKELLCLLGRFGSGETLRDQYSKALPVVEIVCEGCCHALTSKSALPVRNKLAAMLEDLQCMTYESPQHQLENKFSSLASLISIFAMTTPASVDCQEWVKYAPQLLLPTETQNFMNKLQFLYTMFQRKTYTEEKQRLWLAIWQALKTTYLIMRKRSFSFSMTYYPVETEFFQRRTVRNQFELVLSGPEPLHGETVENIVAGYCILVAQSYQGKEAEHNMLRALRPNGMNDSILQTIQDYVGMRQPNDLAITSMEKCAIRLNHLLNGPAFVRRLNPRGLASLGNVTGDWRIENVCLDPAKHLGTPIGETVPAPRCIAVTPLTTVSVQDGPTIKTTTNPLPRVTSARQSSHSATDPTVDDDPDLKLDHTNVVSAFDYVTYPFPETRALEVAQSRQINRELTQAGIHSRGAHEEDVINRPPRHTWPPGTVSIWAKALPIDPINIGRELWSTWCNAQPAKRLLRQAKPHPMITLRRPRKDWVDEHPRLRPLLDPNNRITKSAARKDSKDHGRADRHGSLPTPMFVPKLRGGGPRGMDARDHRRKPAVPVPPSFTSAKTNQTLMDDIHHRTQQLMSRIRGFWRGGDLPPSYLIQQHFLVPNNWHVDAAYQAVRRFVDLGLLDKPINGTHTNDYGDIYNQTNRSITANTHGTTSNIDVFSGLGVSPGAGLDPISYGVPQRHDNVAMAGKQSLRSPSGSPTQQSQGSIPIRRNQFLDPLLPVHLVSDAAIPSDTGGQDIFSSAGIPVQPHAHQSRSPVPTFAAPVSTLNLAISENEGSRRVLKCSNTTAKTNPVSGRQAAFSRANAHPPALKNTDLSFESLSNAGGPPSLLPSRPATRIAGHNLRNRSSLAVQRQARLQALGADLPLTTRTRQTAKTSADPGESTATAMDVDDNSSSSSSSGDDSEDSSVSSADSSDDPQPPPRPAIAHGKGRGRDKASATAAHRRASQLKGRGRAISNVPAASSSKDTSTRVTRRGGGNCRG